MRRMEPRANTSSTSPRLQQPLQSAIAGCFGYIAPEYAQTVRVNEKTDIYSFGVVLLELTTGKAATYGDEYTCLAKWALRHMQEGKPIVDALDEEIKEPCYLDEMSNVFKLGVFCTNTLPSARPKHGGGFASHIRKEPPIGLWGEEHWE